MGKSERAFNDALGGWLSTIYEAALDPTRWPEALAGPGEHFRCHWPALAVRKGAQLGIVVDAMASITDELFCSYVDYY